MLELKGLSRHFGGVRALDRLDLAVAQGEIFGLIGPNGSGKSTMVNVVTGLFAPTAGQILFEGQDIARVPTHKRLALGLARTFQNIRLFANLTVWENLWMAENAPAHQAEASFLKRWVGGRSDARERITRALAFSGLDRSRQAPDYSGTWSAVKDAPAGVTAAQSQRVGVPALGADDRGDPRSGVARQSLSRPEGTRVARGARGSDRRRRRARHDRQW